MKTPGRTLKLKNAQGEVELCVEYLTNEHQFRLYTDHVIQSYDPMVLAEFIDPLVETIEVYVRASEGLGGQMFYLSHIHFRETVKDEWNGILFSEDLETDGVSTDPAAAMRKFAGKPFARLVGVELT